MTGRDERLRGRYDHAPLRASQRRGSNDPRCPNDCTRFEALAVREINTVRVAAGDRGRRHNLNAHRNKRFSRIVGMFLREGWQQARSGFNQYDSRRSRIDAPEVAGECLSRNFSNRTRHLNARRATTDDYECEIPPAFIFVFGKFRLLESGEDTTANARGVLDALEAGSEYRPVVMTEIQIGRARCNHQEVEWEATCLRGDDPPRSVDTGDFRHQDSDIFLLAQNVADWPRDLGGRECGSRNLVKQRLKTMIVVAVYDGHIDRHAP